jgi:hypothetical protein
MDRIIAVLSVTIRQAMRLEHVRGRVFALVKRTGDPWLRPIEIMPSSNLYISRKGNVLARTVNFPYIF